MEQALAVETKAGKDPIRLTNRLGMRKVFFITICLMAMATACTVHSVDNPLDNQSVETVSFRLSPYEGDELESRTSYNTSGDGQFYWAEGDAVGIVSAEGNQLKFPIKQEYWGQDYALFDGRGFALLSNQPYSSYYPFCPDYDLDVTAVPITFDGQKMSGDNSMAGLGAYAYTAAQGSAPQQGTLDFTFRNIASPHRYRMPVPAGEYQALKLTIPTEKFILSGTINLMASSETDLIVITPSVMTDCISLDLQGTAMASTGQLRCWIMLPPVDLTGEVISLKLSDVDGCEYVASVPGRDCPANSRRVFNALTSVGPAVSSVASDGGTCSIMLIRSAASDAVTMSVEAAWISEASSSTDGTITTYSFDISENTGAEREGTISFTETSTGLTNTVLIHQQKAGTVIGIGGWETDNHSGNAN